jgi:Cu/Ag efflux protein CusF
MTMSLTVTPKADLMALTAGSDAEPIASLRWG